MELNESMAPNRASEQPGKSLLSTESDWVEEKLFRVVFNLTSGEWVELGSFADAAQAESCAREAAVQLATTSEWPRVGSRYLRPETIVSIEISERRRLSGSEVRAHYWQGVAE